MISTTLITFNRLAYTRKTIESYLKNTKVSHELIVVDNASTDGTQKYLKTLEKQGFIKQVIYNSENKYPAFATNQGWEVASNKATLLHRSDNDLLYTKGWDTEVLQAFEDIKNLGQLGLLNELYQFSPQDGEQYLKTSNISLIEVGKTKVYPPLNAQRTVGGPCVVKKEVFEKIKWPEDVWLGQYNEDAKYSHLIRQAGYEVFELASERVRHIGYGDIQKYMDYYIETFARRDWFSYFMQRLHLERSGKIKNGKVT